MIRVVFHPDALLELRDQALFYEERSVGLGERFVSQVQAAVAIAASMPGAGSIGRHGTRRVFPKDFPHSVVYRVMPDLLVVVAVAPFRRKPDYWRNRR